MPDITFTAGTVTRTRTVSAAKMQRILDAHRAHFGAELSDQQIAERVLDGLLDQIRAVTEQAEQRAAEDAARASVIFDYD